MKTIKLNGGNMSFAKCVYCGSENGLKQNDIDSLTYFCSNCHRENVLWELRSDYYQGEQTSGSVAKWVFAGVVTLAISLLIILKIVAV